MQRVAVIGNGGGGKSTLSRRIASHYQLPYTEIDALQWKEGWEPVPEEEFLRAHNEIMVQDKWVLDGLGQRPSIHQRLQRATDIVLIDMPLWMHFWLAAERQFAWQQGTLQETVGALKEPPTTKHLFETMWRVEQQWMPEIRTLVNRQAMMGTKVHRITDVGQLDTFVQGS